MSLRPRYSLLTLLVLTALVAGGVKLWYGPHHIIERTATYAEEEYTFTRDWRGNRIIQGVVVKRYEQTPGKPEHVMLVYYRDGLDLNMQRYMILDAGAKKYQKGYDTQHGMEYVLTPQEQAALDQALEQECRRWQARGYSLKPYENSH